MKVLISWSGDASKSIAQTFRDWSRYVIQSLDVWMSEEDIPAGARWAQELGNQLENTNFGIICLTPENILSPWLMFEAGALSKSLTSGRVVPLLFGLKKTDLSGPLSQFQAVETTKTGIKTLVTSLYNASEDPKLLEEIVTNTFEAFWPKLEEDIGRIPRIPSGDKPIRADREILEEILETTRRLSSPLKISEKEIVSYLDEQWERWSREEYRLERIEDRYQGAEGEKVRSASAYIRARMNQYSQATEIIKKLSQS